MDEVIRNNPESSTTNNINEDALTKVLGHPKSGRVLAQGRGVTKSCLSVLDICKTKMNMYEREQENMKTQQESMKTQLAEVIDILKGQVVRSLYTSNDSVNGFIPCKILIYFLL